MYRKVIDLCIERKKKQKNRQPNNYDHGKMFSFSNYVLVFARSCCLVDVECKWCDYVFIFIYIYFFVRSFAFSLFRFDIHCASHFIISIYSVCVMRAANM